MDKFCKKCKKKLCSLNKSGFCRICFGSESKLIKKRRIKPGSIVIIEGGIKRSGKTIKCKECGIELLVIKRRKHCGYCQSCNAKRNLLKLNAPHRKGALHPNWRGGSVSSCRKRALKVFSRKCIVCSEEDRAIEIHHLDGKRDNHIIENLVPLCKSCHRILHYRLKKHCFSPMQALETMISSFANSGKKWP